MDLTFAMYSEIQVYIARFEFYVECDATFNLLEF